MPRNRATPFTRTPHTQKSDARKPNKLLVDDVKVLLINYKENPEKWTLEYIAARYDIPKETAGIQFVFLLNVFLEFGRFARFPLNL